MRTISILVAFLVVVGTSSRALTGDARKDIDAIDTMLKKRQMKEVRALGDKAIPALVQLYTRDRHRPEILMLFANSKSKEARRAIEESLKTESDYDWIYWQARTLGLISNPESKPVLLVAIQRVIARQKELGDRGAPFDGPNPLGVLFGGSTDGAHLALIWALARLEGKDFVKSWSAKDDQGLYTLAGPLDANELNACILWWRKNKKAIITGDL